MPIEMPATLEAEVHISWDGTGAFDGDHDNVTNDVAATPGITIDEGRNGARSLNPPKISATTVNLLNSEGTYSQERADSPVYQRVLPGRPLEVTVQHGADRLYRADELYRADLPYRGKSFYTLASTTIDDISQSTGIGNQVVTLSTLGVEQLLVGTTVSIPLMVAPRVDEVFTAYLDAVGWPADKRVIAVSDTTLLYYFAEERQPWPAMLELLAAEGPGSFYVRAGVFHFENRNYRATADRSITSQATFFDRVEGVSIGYRDDVLYRGDRLYRGTTSGLFFTALSYDPGFRNIYNRATYSTKRRALGSLEAIWSYGSDITLSASQTRTIIAKPTNPFQEAVTPTLTTDYTVSGGTVTVTMSASSGLVAYITITATSGTPTVSGLQLRARSLTVASETIVTNTVDASASIAKYSPIPGADIPRVLSLSGWPEIDPVVAEAVCDAWINRYMVQRPQLTIQLRNADGDHLTKMLELGVSDRIRLVEENTGLSADVWIESKQLRIAGAGGRTVTATLGCEKSEDLDGFAWDDPLSLWGSAIWGT